MPLPKSAAGFTLIEMVVVIGVIAIIAALAVPRVGGVLFEGRGASKTSDLRQMTVAIARYLTEFRTLPAVGGKLPTVSVRDQDGDGIVRIALDTAAGDGQNALPDDIDALCVTASTDLADAVGQCFAAIDVRALDDRLAGRAQHVGEDITLDTGAVPTYDDRQDTADWKGESVNLDGWDMWIYVVDAGAPSGTPFPAGVVGVWNLTSNGRPWALKNDDRYGDRSP